MPEEKPAPSPAVRVQLRRWQVIALGVIFLGWLVLSMLAFVTLPEMLLSAYDGESFDWLNKKIAAHAALAEAEALPTRDREWYADSAKRYSYRGFMFATAAAAIACLGVFYRSTCAVIGRYLLTPDYAFNLGILRAVVFAFLLYSLHKQPIAEIVAMPPDLWKWPALARPALAFVPLTPEYVSYAMPLATVACLLAIFGVFSRWSTLLATALAYTLLGIPGLTGKTNHTHHVLIFAFLISLSRCGYGFSLDNLYRRMKAPTVERADTIPSVEFGLPLRLVSILVATLYFFPGFWKAAVGPAWVLDGALTNITRNIWFQREDFEPIIRVDQLGPLAAIGAIGTIVFEMGFLPALFWRWSRTLFALIGMTFHTMVRLTMGISFYSLQSMYVVFIDFRSLLAWAGERLGPSELTIYYDGNCGLCRKTINLLLELDWLRLLRPVNALDLPEDDPILSSATEDQLLTDMHSLSGSGDNQKVASGFATYQRIANRVPLLWPVAPLLWLPPIASIGRAIYRRIADSRSCRVENTPVTAAAGDPPRHWSRAPILVAFGCAFLGLVGTGFTKMVFAWPVACYPTFDSTSRPYAVWPRFRATTASGERIELDDDPIRKHFGTGNYVYVLNRFVPENQDPEEIIKLLSTLAPIWEQSGEIKPEDPPISIEVEVAHYTLTGPQRPAEPDSTETRLVVNWADVLAKRDEVSR